MGAETRSRFWRWMRGESAEGHTLAPTSRIVLTLGVLLTLSFLAFVLFPPPQAKSLDYLAYDEMIRFLGRDLPPPKVVVVDVDERSLSTVGQWPWPRYRIANLIEKAFALGARGMALDILFTEPDQYSLATWSDAYRRGHGVTLDLAGIPAEAMDNDKVLAEAVARHKVVLGADLKFDSSVAPSTEACGKTISVVLRALPGAQGEPPLNRATSAICPIPALAEAATMVAATNALPDRDGKIRRAPLIMRMGEAWVPGLALGAVLAAAGEKQAVLQWSPAGVLDIRAGSMVIPTDLAGNLLLPYRGRPTDRFQHISAVDLLEGRVSPEQLQDKIILVGTSASGLMDMHATPNMRSCPGVDLHALAIDAILRGDFFVEPAWLRGLQAVAILLAGLLVTTLAAWTRVSAGVAVTAAAVLAVLLGSWAVLDRWGVYWSPVPATLMLVAGASLLTVVRLHVEEKRKKLLRQSFERYVSAAIVNQIIRSPRPVNVSGERRVLSMLMSDIRGFTSMSEKMDPEALVQFLNSYFAAMIDIILANEGTLDKFMGDAVLALFGAPLHHGDDAFRAVKVALEMQEKLRELNEQWASAGQPRIRVGIGISTGEVVVGNIGSSRRLEYTAIGQYVNYAQRIEDLTKDIPCDILISDTTYELVKDRIVSERFGPLTIRGKVDPMCVYGVTGFRENVGETDGN